MYCIPYKGLQEEKYFGINIPHKLLLFSCVCNAVMSPIQMSAPPRHVSPTKCWHHVNYPLSLRGSVAKENTESACVCVHVSMCNHVCVSQCHSGYAKRM